MRRRGSPRLRSGRPAAIILAINLAIILVLAGLYALALASAAMSARPRPADVAVVLGNAVRDDGTPSPRLQARLEAALAVYRAGMVTRILVSGAVEPWNGENEAESMGRFLRARGVPATAIIEDPHGTNTERTAEDARTLLPPGTRLVAVSQWFHLPRTMLALRACGFASVSGAWPRWFEGRDLRSFVREMAALPVYAARLRRGCPQAVGGVSRRRAGGGMMPTDSVIRRPADREIP